MNTKIKYGSKELEKDFGPLTFGKALESHRLAEELSVKDFAKLLKISSQSLCDLEKGRRVPSPERAAKIANKLKEPSTFWIKLALQDLLRTQKINLKVELLEIKKAS
jgi:transcriptional regulator with XRE-family HTH domain